MQKRESGAAIIEFALILPLLLLLGMITTEIGRAMYQYNTIVKSLRGAVRYIAVQTENTHITETKNLVVYGNLAGTGTPLTPGLSLSHVQTPVWADVNPTAPDVYPIIRTVTITVSGYTFRSLFQGAFGVLIGDANRDIPFSSITVTMRSTPK